MSVSDGGYCNTGRLVNLPGPNTTRILNRQASVSLVPENLHDLETYDRNLAVLQSEAASINRLLTRIGSKAAEVIAQDNADGKDLNGNPNIVALIEREKSTSPAPGRWEKFCQALGRQPEPQETRSLRRDIVCRFTEGALDSQGVDPGKLTALTVKETEWHSSGNFSSTGVKEYGFCQDSGQEVYYNSYSSPDKNGGLVEHWKHRVTYRPQFGTYQYNEWRR